METIISDDIKPGMLFIQELDSTTTGTPRRRLWVTVSHVGAGTWDCIFFQPPITSGTNYSAGRLSKASGKDLEGWDYCGRIPKASELLDGVLFQDHAALAKYDETDQEDDLDDILNEEDEAD